MCCSYSEEVPRQGLLQHIFVMKLHGEQVPSGQKYSRLAPFLEFKSQTLPQNFDVDVN